MRTVTITQFCQEASHLLSNVEKGETYTAHGHNLDFFGRRFSQIHADKYKKSACISVNLRPIQKTKS